MVTDEDLIGFLQAVYDVAQNQSGWRAQDHQIMRQMDTDDRQFYQELARRCEAVGYINKRSDHYELVRLTDAGIRYVEGGFTAL